MSDPKLFYDFSLVQYNILKELYLNLEKKRIETLKIIILIIPIMNAIVPYLLDKQFSFCSFIFFIISNFFGFFTLVYGIRSLRPSGFKLINPSKLYERYLNSESSDIYEQIVATMGESFILLRDTTSKFSKEYNNTIKLLAITIFLYFVTYCLILIQTYHPTIAQTVIEFG